MFFIPKKKKIEYMKSPLGEITIDEGKLDSKSFTAKNLEISASQAQEWGGLVENQLLVLDNGKKESIVNLRLTEKDHSRVSIDIRQDFLGQTKVSKLEGLIMSKFMVQKKAKVVAGIITLPQCHRSFIEKSGATHLQLVNNLSGSSMDIPLEKIEFQEMNEDSIRMNRFHRQMLCNDYPKLISAYQYETLCKATTDEAERGMIEKLYGKNSQVNRERLMEEGITSTELSNILMKSQMNTLSIYPVIDGKLKLSLLKRVKELLLKLYIHDTRQTLKVIRPYETDEFNRVVRMTKSSFDLLGIDDTDVVIVAYRNKRAKVRALMLDDQDIIKELNVIDSTTELDMAIGIPVSVRDELGIPNIEYACEVYRDKDYLMRKNVSLQFLTLVGTLITVEQMNLPPVWKGICLVIVMPLTMYFVLSEIRNKVTTW